MLVCPRIDERLCRIRNMMPSGDYGRGVERTRKGWPRLGPSGARIYMIGRLFQTKGSLPSFGLDLNEVRGWTALSGYGQCQVGNWRSRCSRGWISEMQIGVDFVGRIQVWKLDHTASNGYHTLDAGCSSDRYPYVGRRNLCLHSSCFGTPNMGY